MQIQYFKSAWGDIKNSPGWFGKLCLLALLNFIPIFGQIVTFGYLYGWAREIAWGTHEPMPARIFGNEDGKLYRRGWFILVLVFVAALVPYIVMSIGSGLQGAGLWGIAAKSRVAANSVMSGVGFLVYLVGLVGFFLLTILAWIGSMRISIYDRLSAGFQLGKIWKMFRHDTGGAMRIFGMYLLVGFIIGIVLSIVITVVMLFVVFAGVAGMAASGYDPSALRHMSDSQAMGVAWSFFGGAGAIGLLGILVVGFLAEMGAAFVLMLVARASGYWTMQFDVPRWRGQDDPMPFEAAVPMAGYAPANPMAQPPAQAPYNPVAQPAQQQPQPAQQPQPMQQPLEPVSQPAPQDWQASQPQQLGSDGQTSQPVASAPGPYAAESLSQEPLGEQAPAAESAESSTEDVSAGWRAEDRAGDSADDSSDSPESQN